jgi:hypothetical protein
VLKPWLAAQSGGTVVALVPGLLMLALALGAQWPPGGVWTPLLLGMYALSPVLADGFPAGPGTPPCGCGSADLCAAVREGLAAAPSPAGSANAMRAVVRVRSRASPRTIHPAFRQGNEPIAAYSRQSFQLTDSLASS